LLPIPVALILVNIVNAALSHAVWPILPATFIALCMVCGLYTSRRGKFVVWAGLLDQLKFRGEERILDIGCGRTGQVKEPIWLNREDCVAIHEMMLSQHGGLAGVRDEGVLESVLSKRRKLFAYGSPHAARYGRGP